MATGFKRLSPFPAPRQRFVIEIDDDSDDEAFRYSQRAATVAQLMRQVLALREEADATTTPRLTREDLRILANELEYRANRVGK